MSRPADAATDQTVKAAERSIRELIDWAASVGPSDLPERVRRPAVLVLCDDVVARMTDGAPG